MHAQLVMLIAAATFVSTLVGGAAALKLRDRLHLILGFSAGAVIAVAFFDLIPESLNLGIPAHQPSTLLSFTAIGFFAYMILDRLILFHTHLDDHHPSPSVQRGWAGAASLSAHSFMDGFSIGIAFQASTAAGFVVALAVLAHDFSDGLNTVNLVLKNGGTRRQAFGWLTLDALTPVAGAGVSLLVRLPGDALSLVLALFAGFFFYIGGSDLLPDSYHAHPKFLTTIMTLLGAGILYLVVRVAG
jgi:ZIP family zinc transporter